jgi:phage shock protein PspC (stress-responsive transcriptional regulator)
MRTSRTEGALLAGVCAGIARALNWNVWVLRGLFVLFLLIKTLWAVAAYAALALTLFLVDGRRREASGEDRLESPELADRSRRIEELERRFRDLENGSG